MALAFSYEADQLWSDKTAFDRNQWFDKHSDRVARSRGAVINALRDHAQVIKETKAHEHHAFDAEKWVSDQLDTLDFCLAPEVSEWLNL